MNLLLVAQQLVGFITCHYVLQDHTLTCGNTDTNIFRETP